MTGTFIPTKDELSTSLAEAKDLNPDDYTKDTWNILTALFSDIEDVIGRDDATQADINTAAANLAVAVDGLRRKANTKALKEQIQNLSDKMALESWNLLTAEQQQKYNDLLTNATDLSNDEEALQSVVDDMKTKVENAVTELAELYSCLLYTSRCV